MCTWILNIQQPPAIFSEGGGETVVSGVTAPGYRHRQIMNHMNSSCVCDRVRWNDLSETALKQRRRGKDVSRAWMGELHRVGSPPHKRSSKEPSWRTPGAAAGQTVPPRWAENETSSANLNGWLLERLRACMCAPLHFLLPLRFNE